MPTAARRCADALWRAAQLLAGAVMAISFMTPAVRGEPVVLADPTLPLLQTWTHRRFVRSEEHTSELQSLMRISYAVFCLKKKKIQNQQEYKVIHISIQNNIWINANSAYHKCNRKHQ